MQPAGVGDAGPRVAPGSSRRRAGVGARGHEPERRARRARSRVAQELGDRVVALVLQRLGRHRQPRVVGEQRDDARRRRRARTRRRTRRRSSRSRGELGQRRALAARGQRARRASPRARCRALFTDASLRARASPRPRRRGSRARRAARAPRAAGRQALQPGDERQRRPPPASRSAPRDPARRRAGPRAGRRGRAPARAARPGGWARAEPRKARRAHAGPAAAVAQRVQAPVGRDPVQPGAQRRAVLEAVKPAPGRQQRLLDHVLGVLHRAENPVAVQLQLAPVGVGELAERLLVARPGARRASRRHLASSHASSFAWAGNDTSRAGNSSVNSPAAPVSAARP